MTDVEPAVYSVYLNVDPEEDNAKAIMDALEDEGYDVHTVKRLDVRGLSWLADEEDDG